MSSLSFVEQLQLWRVRRAARKCVRKVAHSGGDGSAAAAAMLQSDEDFAEFVESAIVKQQQSMGGPLLDMLEALIQDFIDNPEKWIKVIIDIIGLF